MTTKKNGPALIERGSKTSTKATKLSHNTSTPKKSSGCCMGTTTCPPSSSSKATSAPAELPSKLGLNDSKRGPKTRILIKYDVGFKNVISIRGNGAGLSWDKGLLLKNVKPDEWIFETDLPFTTGEFKVLINDEEYESGENHTLRCGASIQYSPEFQAKDL